MKSEGTTGNGTTNGTTPLGTTEGSETDARAARDAALALATKARDAAKNARTEAARLAKEAKDAKRAALEAAALLPKDPTPRGYVRDLSRSLVIVADLLAEIAAPTIPETIRGEVLASFANRLHHLAVPAEGWPAGTLPIPDRSEWNARDRAARERDGRPAEATAEILADLVRFVADLVPADAPAEAEAKPKPKP